MNIMIVTNSAYLKSTYIMLYSLFLQHHQEKMNIYLPYEDISENELEKINAPKRFGRKVMQGKKYIHCTLEKSSKRKYIREMESMLKLIIVYWGLICYRNQWRELYIWMWIW